jgi:hypothetical protein
MDNPITGNNKSKIDSGFGAIPGSSQTRAVIETEIATIATPIASSNGAKLRGFTPIESPGKSTESVCAHNRDGSIPPSQNR